MPDETITAFRDHGRVEDTIERDLDAARDGMKRLAAIGIDFDRVTSDLVDEGIDKFVKPFDALLAALDEKRRTVVKSA